MGNFSGQLRSNEIFTALYNMIISQQVFADNIGKHQTLVDKARVDGGLYGDTKLYYATDVLKSAPWGNDAEATNLLQLHRPDAPSCQAIYLDIFRQIPLTVDNYLSKRAWSTEGAFSEFTSVMLGWIRETKKVYDGTLYNTYIGTTETNVGSQIYYIDIAGARANASTELEADKLEAFEIAEKIANLLVLMGDYSRDFNDYGYLRSYADADIKVIWNADYVNKVKKVDLPTIFHKDGLIDKFDEEVLPARYFGTIQTTAVNDSDNDGSYQSLYEMSYIPAGETDPVDIFAGDFIPAGIDIPLIKDSQGNNIPCAYKVDSSVICKVLVKLPPFMSAFEVGTSFFNPKSLTENHYLTWGHNSLEYLKNYPFITVKAK